MIKVPYGLTVHGEEEIEAVLHVLRTSTQMGPHVREFEDKVATLFGKKRGVMVNSGSSALQLAVEILDLPGNAEVITPALTFATTVAAIVKNNLVPAFVDVEPLTFCIDPSKVESMITPKTKAMCIPNLLGNIAKWSDLRSIAKKYDLRIIEDSADTLGGELEGKTTGYFSDISITSFYGSHVINCAGNGGMLCLDDEKMYNKAKLLRSWGRSSSLFEDSENIENRFNIALNGIDYDSKFIFETIGYNYEPSEIGAAFGLVQLKKLENNINARIDNFNELSKYFSKYQSFFDLGIQTSLSKTGWLAFPLIVKDDAPFKRRDLQVHFEKNNIQTRVIFTGNINYQPGFINIKKKIDPNGYPESDYVMRGGMLIGCHHGLTKEMMHHIQNVFEGFISKY